jgi:hypothetical protein
VSRSATFGFLVLGNLQNSTSSRQSTPTCPIRGSLDASVRGHSGVVRHGREAMWPWLTQESASRRGMLIPKTSVFHTGLQPFSYRSNAQVLHFGSPHARTAAWRQCEPPKNY